MTPWPVHIIVTPIFQSRTFRLTQLVRSISRTWTFALNSCPSFIIANSCWLLVHFFRIQILRNWKEQYECANHCQTVRWSSCAHKVKKECELSRLMNNHQRNILWVNKKVEVFSISSTLLHSRLTPSSVRKSCSATNPEFLPAPVAPARKAHKRPDTWMIDQQ